MTEGGSIAPCRTPTSAHMPLFSTGAIPASSVEKVGSSLSLPLPRGEGLGVMHRQVWLTLLLSNCYSNTYNKAAYCKTTTTNIAILLCTTKVQIKVSKQVFSFALFFFPTVPSEMSS